jgi:hypothetical protein
MCANFGVKLNQKFDTGVTNMITNNVKWPRRAEFVNMLLAMGIAYGDIRLRDVVFDGIAGNLFDKAIRKARNSDMQCNEYVGVALKLGVPIEGLVADGTFGEKWEEVVALCKEEASLELVAMHGFEEDPPGLGSGQQDPMKDIL